MRSEINDDGSGCVYDDDGYAVFHGGFKGALIYLGLVHEARRIAEAEVARLEVEIGQLKIESKQLLHTLKHWNVATKVNYGTQMLAERMKALEDMLLDPAGCGEVTR